MLPNIHRNVNSHKFMLFCTVGKLIVATNAAEEERLKVSETRVNNQKLRQCIPY